ncbi:hypothetical protein MIZ01_1596 [Sideroxyarcus emersonii]|uniref:Uncharacterized protein n=1 Tax=Sideroxyarcus emersonii TaxID=2764705 RepID=A0AAN1XA81_9PROT|nr:hypothetical protein [Sideroxyarcus emersonii]BCK87800.1 hypothetical protein MIZ01_1596 [Sideroxyarcus emersonii]
MNTVSKIKEINDNYQDRLSEFEKNFIADNIARIGKWGDDTRFSEKQVGLVDRIYKERVEEGRAPGAKGG